MGPSSNARWQAAFSNTLQNLEFGFMTKEVARNHQKTAAQTFSNKRLRQSKCTKVKVAISHLVPRFNASSQLLTTSGIICMQNCRKQSTSVHSAT